MKLFFAVIISLALLVSEETRAGDVGAQHVLFLGSSSIAQWTTLAKDFPGMKTVNLGAGGTGFAYLADNAPAIAKRYPVKRIVLYSGDNDVAWGDSPEKVAENFRRTVEIYHKLLPEVRIFVLAIKLCREPARRAKAEEVRKANALIERIAKDTDYIRFVDVHTPMLDSAGEPRAELFLEDGIHLSPAGYEIWTKTLAPFLGG